MTTCTDPVLEQLAAIRLPLDCPGHSLRRLYRMRRELYRIRRNGIIDRGGRILGVYVIGIIALVSAKVRQHYRAAM